jgi:hypothetical protein
LFVALGGCDLNTPIDDIIDLVTSGAAILWQMLMMYQRSQGQSCRCFTMPSAVLAKKHQHHVLLVVLPSLTTNCAKLAPSRQ